MANCCRESPQTTTYTDIPGFFQRGKGIISNHWCPLQPTPPHPPHPHSPPIAPTHPFPHPLLPFPILKGHKSLSQQLKEPSDREHGFTWEMCVWVWVCGDEMRWVGGTEWVEQWADCHFPHWKWSSLRIYVSTHPKVRVKCQLVATKRLILHQSSSKFIKKNKHPTLFSSFRFLQILQSTLQHIF